MTVFGREATPAEIDYWKPRVPATQAELVKINLDWLVSEPGAKDLTETVQRAFKAVFGRMPTTTEQSAWEASVRKTPRVYAELMDAMQGTIKTPPAFPAIAESATVYQCPSNVFLRVGGQSYPLSGAGARSGQGYITCDYTTSQNITINVSGACPSEAPNTSVGGSDIGKTAEGPDCKMGSAWCRGGGSWSGKLTGTSTSTSCEYTGGIVSLQLHVDRTCWGGVSGSNQSPNGRFLCF